MQSSPYKVICDQTEGELISARVLEIRFSLCDQYCFCEEVLSLYIDLKMLDEPCPA